MDLSDPILSRFDVLCVVRDRPDPVEDDHMASFVINNHRKLHPDAQEARKEADKDKDKDTEKVSTSIHCTIMLLPFS